MLASTLVILFQAVAGAPAQAPEASAVPAVEAATPAAEEAAVAAAPAEQPAVAEKPAKAGRKRYCRVENVTGSRARKQRVCGSDDWDKSADQTQANFNRFIDKNRSMGQTIYGTPGSN